MKKKLGLLIGCALFVILAVGSIPSDQKDNVKVNDKNNQTQTSGNNSEKQPKQEEKKEYEISNVKIKRSQFLDF